MSYSVSCVLSCTIQISSELQAWSVWLGSSLSQRVRMAVSSVSLWFPCWIFHKVGILAVIKHYWKIKSCHSIFPPYITHGQKAELGQEALTQSTDNLGALRASIFFFDIMEATRLPSDSVSPSVKPAGFFSSFFFLSSLDSCVMYKSICSFLEEICQPE